VRDCFAVAREWVFGFGWREFGDFSFVDFFGFLDSEACCQCGPGKRENGWWLRVSIRAGDRSGKERLSASFSKPFTVLSFNSESAILSGPSAEPPAPDSSP